MFVPFVYTRRVHLSFVRDLRYLLTRHKVPPPSTPHRVDNILSYYLPYLWNVLWVDWIGFNFFSFFISSKERNASFHFY